MTGSADPQPLVSIVTPSFQASRFIERTIASVLAQTYPRIEYIVMDGGSTDGTIDILNRYRERLRFSSGPDAGAADAINRGFAQSQGSIFAWLSADDIYDPHAVETVLRHFGARPQVGVIYGEAVWIDEDDKILDRYPVSAPFDAEALSRECTICQPAAFIRREKFESAGMLNRDLRFAFDYDLWVRLAKTCALEAIPEVLAKSRMHRANKTLGSRRQVFEENIGLLRRHYGYVPLNWIYGYLACLRDGRDQFFDPQRHYTSTYLWSLPAGLRYNYLHPFRYAKEWKAKLGTPSLRRLLGRTQP